MIFLPEPTFSADSLTVYVHPEHRTHLHLWARQRSCSPHQSSADYGNTETPSMHRRFGGATLIKLMLMFGPPYPSSDRIDIHVCVVNVDSGQM